MPGRPGAGTRTRAAADANAVAHLAAADPVMAGLIARDGPPELEPDPTRRRPVDHYGALLRAITGQQLSTKAARVIYGRLLDHFGGHTPTPEQVLGADPEEMRAAAGLSRAKVLYLRSLAEHVVSGDLELERLPQLPDEDIVRELTAVKGIGQWSAQMFLIFQLGRPDVPAWGDLGVRRGAQLAYGLGDLPSPGELDALAVPWTPHRSMACRILWRSLDNEPE